MSHHEHPNATLFREMEAKLKAEGPQAMTDYLADDVEWHEIGRAEPIRGKAALAERWAGLGDMSAFSVDVHDTVANDDHVVQLVTATVTLGDKTLVYRTAEIYHVRDGKVTARWAFSDDTAAINEFFAGT
ncbi:MAG TPA: nuclear transport factor 2 family protein [Pleomorphomonadaceae bacterium]|nr:nuclear transport factor 2 family protein [Pleomorphomonadaceae bacterium]